MITPKIIALSYFHRQLEASQALGLSLKQYILSPYSERVVDINPERHRLQNSQAFIEDLRREHPEREMK